MKLQELYSTRSMPSLALARGWKKWLRLPLKLSINLLEFLIRFWELTPFPPLAINISSFTRLQALHFTIKPSINDFLILNWNVKNLILENSTTLVFKSSGPITKPIATGTLTKLYGSLRYIVKRPIPSPEEVDLAREEDFFYPDEPLSQAAIRTKV